MERDLGEAGDAFAWSGQAVEGMVEGILFSTGGGRLNLKAGTYENWIPRDKVLFMRVSR